MRKVSVKEMARSSQMPLRRVRQLLAAAHCARLLIPETFDHATGNCHFEPCGPTCQMHERRSTQCVERSELTSTCQACSAWRHFQGLGPSLLRPGMPANRLLASSPGAEHDAKRLSRRGLPKRQPGPGQAQSIALLAWRPQLLRGIDYPMRTA